MIGIDNSVLDTFNKMHTREEVEKCPHLMNLLFYLSKKHGIPKYGWQETSLRYHYTDAEGLLGIIQTGRLWATDIRFLNDPSEGLFFPERLLAHMESKPGGINDTEKEIINGLKEALRNPILNNPSFCVSLSANGDLLSQWRGYGSFGNGYAVGLNLKGNLPHPQIAHYYDVTYGDEKLEKLALDLLDLFSSAFINWQDSLFGTWASTLLTLAKSFKDRSYREEEESRLICSHTDEGKNLFKDELPLRFRTRGGDIVPYIPMSLNALRDTDKPRLPIEHIVAGPGVDFYRNEASIRKLLKENSYDNVMIEKSAIPFRP